MKTIIVAVLLLASCTSGPPLTEFEKEYNRQMSMENWILCEQVYERAGAPTYHRSHSHRNMSPRREAQWVKQDLMDNGCRQILKDYWIEGY